jgi:hypothetical protein
VAKQKQQLPATMFQAVALRFAREWIAGQREPGGIFHPDAERQYGRELIKRFALVARLGKAVCRRAILMVPEG